MHCSNIITPIVILSTRAQSSNRMDIIDFLLVRNHLDDGAHLHNGQSPSNIQSPERIIKESVLVIVNPEASEPRYLWIFKEVFNREPL